MSEQKISQVGWVFIMVVVFFSIIGVIWLVTNPKPEHQVDGKIVEAEFRAVTFVNNGNVTNVRVTLTREDDYKSAQAYAWSQEMTYVTDWEEIECDAEVCAVNFSFEGLEPEIYELTVYYIDSEGYVEISPELSFGPWGNLTNTWFGNL